MRSPASRTPTARTPRTPVEGVEVERLFQALTRKPVLTLAEQLQLEQLRHIVANRASGVGLGYASGGKHGLP